MSKLHREYMRFSEVACEINQKSHAETSDASHQTWWLVDSSGLTLSLTQAVTTQSMPVLDSISLASGSSAGSVWVTPRFLKPMLVGIARKHTDVLANVRVTKLTRQALLAHGFLAV